MQLRRAASLVVVGACLLVACSGGGDDEGSPSTDAGGDASITAPDREVPVVGGTLRLGVGTIASLDPALLSPDSVSASIAADLLFDGLTDLPSGADAAEPRIASSWTSPDSITWTFTIDPDARFGDGTAVTATDVEFSLERVVSQGSSSLVASRLDAVAGVAEYLAAGGGAAGVDLPSISAVDPGTVQIVLARPMAWLPELLSAPAYGIVSKAAATTDGAAFGAGPSVGSGPFRLAERDGDVLAFARAPDRRSFVDRIELRQYTDLAVAFDDFEADRLDWTVLPPSRVDAAAERYGTDGFVPFQAEIYFGFNMQDPTFADVRFRQAILQAVDRDALVNAVYFGIVQPLAGIVPTGVPGADPSRCADGCRHDPAAATALLAAAFPDGAIPTVNLDYADGTDENAVAGIIQQNLQAVGIPVALRPLPAEQSFTFADSGSQAFVSLGWIGVAATPEDYLDRLYRSTSRDNITGLNDPNVDALLDQAATTQDADARVALVGQAEAAVLALAPALPLAQFRVLAVAHDDVHDLDVGVDGTFDGEAVWLEP